MNAFTCTTFRLKNLARWILFSTFWPENSSPCSTHFLVQQMINSSACLQVRMKLVKDWLPVLIVCRDNVSPMSPGHKSLYIELEETFLRIISTLPMSEAQEMLQQCLSFSTRNVEDCPHLVSAFNTWFRRAMRPPQRNLFQNDATPWSFCIHSQMLCILEFTRCCVDCSVYKT